MRVGRVDEDPREDVRVGVGVVEFHLYQLKCTSYLLYSYGRDKLSVEENTAEKQCTMNDWMWSVWCRGASHECGGVHTDTQQGHLCVARRRRQTTAHSANVA